MAPETPILRDAIRTLHQAGMAVVALVSDLPNTERDHFVGIDNIAAGRAAGILMGRFMGGGTGQVVVIGQSMLLRESVERRFGFDQVMLRDFSQIEVLQTLESHGRSQLLVQVLQETLNHTTDIKGIYLLGAGHRALSHALHDLELTGRMVVVGHELTPHARSALETGAMDAVITQNVGHVVRSALRILRARTDRMPIDPGQEQIRIEIVIRETLPHTPGDSQGRK